MGVAFLITICNLVIYSESQAVRLATGHELSGEHSLHKWWVDVMLKHRVLSGKIFHASTASLIGIFDWHIALRVSIWVMSV